MIGVKRSPAGKRPGPSRSTRPGKSAGASKASSRVYDGRAPVAGSLDLARQEDVDALYRMAIDKFGRESQAENVIEEAAELIHAICKHKRKAAQGKFAGPRLDAVIEEIADVQIALDQAKLIYCGQSPEAEKAFEDMKRRKLEKLAAKLAGK